MQPRFERREQELSDDCQVPSGLFHGVQGRLESFAESFLESLPSPESQDHGRADLAGLLSDLERKNAETIA